MSEFIPAYNGLDRLAEGFKRLCDDYGIDPDDTSYSGAEDAGSYLDPGDPDYELAPFVLVTHAGEYTYLKCYRTFDKAVADAFANADDATYAEFPSAIVNLENGAYFVPCFNETPWKMTD